MKRQRWARHAEAVESAITRAAGSRPIPGNRVTPLIDGEDSYRVMREAIAGARRWIHFENYIIRSDEVGWEFARLLAAQAQKGIRVRVLYDWLGCLATSRRYWRFLREAFGYVQIRPGAGRVRKGKNRNSNPSCGHAPATQ